MTTRITPKIDDRRGTRMRAAGEQNKKTCCLLKISQEFRVLVLRFHCLVGHAGELRSAETNNKTPFKYLSTVRVHIHVERERCQRSSYSRLRATNPLKVSWRAPTRISSYCATENDRWNKLDKKGHEGFRRREIRGEETGESQRLGMA